MKFRNLRRVNAPCFLYICIVMFFQTCQQQVNIVGAIFERFFCQIKEEEYWPSQFSFGMGLEPAIRYAGFYKFHPLPL